MRTLQELVELSYGLKDEEKEIFDNILCESEKNDNIKILDIARNNFTSTSRIIRICKILGLSGFAELKHILKNNDEILDEFVNSDRDCVTNIAIGRMRKEINETFFGLDSELIEEAANLIINARKVCIFGGGHNTEVTEGIFRNLSLLNINAQQYNESYFMYNISQTLTSDDVVIVLSMSGETTHIVQSAGKAMKNGAKIISLTGPGKNKLNSFADVKLTSFATKIPESNFDVRSRVSMKMVLHIVLETIIIKKSRVI